LNPGPLVRTKNAKTKEQEGTICQNKNLGSLTRGLPPSSKKGEEAGGYTKGKKKKLDD